MIIKYSEDLPKVIAPALAKSRATREMGSPSPAMFTPTPPPNIATGKPGVTGLQTTEYRW